MGEPMATSKRLGVSPSEDSETSNSMLHPMGLWVRRMLVKSSSRLDLHRVPSVIHLKAVLFL